MAEIKRKDGESFESFLRRFKLYLQNSKKLNKAKEKRYLNSKMNKRERKQQALVGKQIREKKEYLKKIGKLPEDER
ncbi:MAG TPA: 30S ribosomal protein S21 [Patescibacteria group bacterium]|nr:30S ribosomal protein S21 [Patescibacteria group bacterium]